MAQTSAFMGFVHRRRRGAELFLLVLALAVGIGAYAAVGLGVEGEVPADIIGYGGWLAALVDRRARRRPAGRAVRRPGAAAGRRRPQRPRPRGHPPARPRLRGRRPAQHDFAQQQLIWMTLGVVAVRGHAAGAARPPRAAAVHLHRRPGRDRAAPAADGARARHDHQRRPDLDQRRPVQLPARRGRQGAAGRSPSPATSCCTATRWRWPAAGCSSSTCPAAATSARSSSMWLVSLGILVFQRDLGSSLLFFGLFLVMLYVATERPGWLVVGGLLFVGGALLALPARSATSRAASTSGCDPFDYYDDGTGAQLPARRGDVRHGAGAG